MILVFGGTTEGRRAAEVLEEAGRPFCYSTKTGEQDVVLHHGWRTDGAMDAKAMQAFCRAYGIRLVVDAAHPFAVRLHETIARVARTMQLPVVRYERLYPPRDPQLEWIDDYAQVPTNLRSLLATTGVQSIGKLKYLEALGIKVVYRILNRESSIRQAHEQGACDGQLCYYPQLVEADAVLMKESGESGGFSEKVAEAKSRGMRIIVLRRPDLAACFTSQPYSQVDGPHGLRREVERLLPTFFPLHSGLTTGTCATAAAIAAVQRMLRGTMPQEVPVVLPNGETIQVAVGYGDGYAYCVKQAGDDPDVTDGVEIRASVALSDHFEILGGAGVGRFTLSGFDFPPGEAAINKGPREMIRKNLEPFSILHSPCCITISVPHGEEIARKTFNPRLGIVGGISIIGVSGIVKPFSEEAFIGSIRKCMQVAKASGAGQVVLNSGGKSERFLRQRYEGLPSQAFVQYGNYIGQALRMADELGFPRVTLGVMLGKAVKLAEGQLDTHSRRGTMNPGFVRRMLLEAHCDGVDVGDITLARELWDMIPATGLEAFCRVVLRHSMAYCQPLVPRARLTLLLIADDGTIHSL